VAIHQYNVQGIQIILMTSVRKTGQSRVVDEGVRQRSPVMHIKPDDSLIMKYRNA